MAEDYSKYVGNDKDLDKQILECLHNYHEDVEKMYSNVENWTNNERGMQSMMGAQVSPSGNIGGYGGYGLGLGGGDNSLTAVILLILAGQRGFNGNDCDDKDRLLIVEALKGKQEAVEKITERTGIAVELMKSTLCEVNAKIEAAGVKVDCVGETARQALDRVQAVGDKICDFRHDVAVAFGNIKQDVAKEFGDVRYRDLENKQEVKDFARLLHKESEIISGLRFDKLDCKVDTMHHHMEKEFCSIKEREDKREIEYWKNKAQNSDKDYTEERRSRENEKNIQIIGSTLETTLVNLLSNNTAGGKKAV